jgi:hypothetical protein
MLARGARGRSLVRPRTKPPVHRPVEFQLIGGIILGDRQVAISNAEIHAQWPGPPRANDRCVIDGRTTTIQACDTRRLRNEIVLHLIQVRG